MEYLIAGEMQRYSELAISEFIKVESQSQGPGKPDGVSE